jgi:hypothetical protein
MKISTQQTDTPLMDIRSIFSMAELTGVCRIARFLGDRHCMAGWIEGAIYATGSNSWQVVMASGIQISGNGFFDHVLISFPKLF